MRRLFPLALLLLACPSKKDPVGEPLDAAVVMGGAEDGWLLTPEKVEGYLRYQKATLVHMGLAQPNAFDGGQLKSFQDTPEAHADFDEWLRKTNGLTEDDVKRLDQMMGPLAVMTVFQMTPSQEAAEKQAAELAVIPPGEKERAPPPIVKLNDGKKQLDDMRKRFGEGNVKVLMTRQYDLVQNWLKLTGVHSDVPEIVR
ncbi:MAG: hypothetical protein QM723_31980 [Myxococcaceae bacterium]